MTSQQGVGEIVLLVDDGRRIGGGVDPSYRAFKRRRWTEEKEEVLDRLGTG